MIFGKASEFTCSQVNVARKAPHTRSTSNKYQTSTKQPGVIAGAATFYTPPLLFLQTPSNSKHQATCNYARSSEDLRPTLFDFFLDHEVSDP